jgi:pyruvate/2-oxoacid:ferredoxin oxidoreductase alpha subunit
MRKLLMGNHAISYGATLSRPQVISAYPITPQTQVVELLSEIVADGKLAADFIKVESEHSALAACVGASAAGARTFTATSAQGLLLMHEVLHWAGRGRLPVVMANVNRAIFPGWTIWTDQNDSLAQRDTGWIQIYASDNQEVLDSIILAYRIAEKMLLPVMVNLDAFFLSHTYEAVDVPDQEAVDKFLPPFKPEWKLDTQNPRAFGGLTSPAIYMEFQYNTQKAMEATLPYINEAGREYEKITGRFYGNIEGYKTEDAECVLITSGTIGRTANIVIDELRAQGVKIGNLRIRTFRPLPIDEIAAALSGKKKAFVIDRNLSFGHSGIFFEEIKAGLYNRDVHPKMFGFVAGLGGRDVTPGTIHEIVDHGMKHDKPDQDVIWIGVNR